MSPQRDRRAGSARCWQMLVIVAAILALALGCRDREKKVYLPVPMDPGSPEFGTAKALDLPSGSGPGDVTFEASRFTAVSEGGDAMAAYLADDGTGTVRLHVIHYDHSRNPIIRYFTEPEVFDANSGDVTDAMPLLDGQGDGLLVWVQDFAGKPRLFASVYHAGDAGFTPPQLIDAGGENTSADGVGGFDAALDAAGNAIIAFFENPAAPALSEAFGVFYDKSAGTFSLPEKVDLYHTAGHTVSRVRALGGPAGLGYVLTLQDADGGPGTVIHCSVSRFSSESSLSAFNAVTRVNPPGYDDDVADFCGVVLPDGDGLFLYEQAHPSTGVSRVWWRVFDMASETFTEAFPNDLAPQASASGLGLQDPAISFDGSTAVALFRTSGAASALHANLFRNSTRTFDAATSTVVSAGSGTVSQGYHFVFGPGSAGETVFVQQPVAQGPSRLFASRLDLGTGVFAAPRPIDPGAVETGALSTLPMAYATPVPVGSGFDCRGRFLAAFTLSDGLTTRLYVNRGYASDPEGFEGAEPVDDASRTIFAATLPSYSEVVAGDAVFRLGEGGREGVALWRHREVSGVETTVRLHGNKYHGFNLAAPPELTGAVLVDEHPESTTDSSVTMFDGTGTSAGGIVAFVQEEAGTPELYIRGYLADADRFEMPGLYTQDNGSAGDIRALRVSPGRGDDAFVFFLQDDGAGTDRLYGRHYRAATGLVEPLRGGAAVSLSLSGPSYGAVTDLDAASLGGRVFVVFRQAEGAGHGAFGLRVDADGAVTGPVRLGSPGAFDAGPPRVLASTRNTVLALFSEGDELQARVCTAEQFGTAVTGDPATVDGDGSAPAGAFDADVDGFGNYLVACETGTPAAGRTIEVRRYFHDLQQWETPLAASGQGTGTLDHLDPRVRAEASGRAVLLYRRVDASASGDVSLMATTFDAGAQPIVASPIAVDVDGTTPSGLDVSAGSIALDAGTGRGFIAFTQDADATASVRDRLYVRGFDLARIGTATPVFYVTPVDMTVGGASAQTQAVLFEAGIGEQGRGFLVHGENLPGAAADTLTHLFCRPFDAETFTFGSAQPASRKMNFGDAVLTGEGVDAVKILMSTDAPKAILLHTVAQTDTGSSTTYRRLFANVLR